MIFCYKVFKPSFLNNTYNIDNLICSLKLAIDLPKSLLSLNYMDFRKEFEMELKCIKKGEYNVKF